MWSRWRADPEHRAFCSVPNEIAGTAADDLDRFARGVADAVAERLLPHLDKIEGRLQVLARSIPASKDVDNLWDTNAAGRRGSTAPGRRGRTSLLAGLDFTGLQEALGDRRHRRSLVPHHDSSSRPSQGQCQYRPLSANASGSDSYSDRSDDERSTLLVRCASCWEWQEPARSGFLADIVLSGWFNNLSFCVICLNAVFIWCATNYTSLNTKMELPLYMHVIEDSFVFYYLCEVALRLLLHRLFFFWNEDWGWNIFDLVIVCFGLWDVILEWEHVQPEFDVSFLRVSRVLRVTKILRIFRAFKFMSELQVMLACVLGSIVSLLWSCIFLLVILMLSALIIVQSMTNYRIDHSECADTEPCQHMREWFGSVSSAMVSLFMSTTGGVDWGDMYAVVRLGGPALSIFYMCYIIFFNFAFFNIVTSIFVDKAMKLAKPDEESIILERKAHEAEIDRMLRDLFMQVDIDGSGVISIDELKEASQDHRVLHKFERLDITVRDVQTFFSTLLSHAQGDSIGVETFVEGCLKMRGPASSLDVQAMRFQVQSLCDDIRKSKARHTHAAP